MELAAAVCLGFYCADLNHLPNDLSFTFFLLKNQFKEYYLAPVNCPAAIFQCQYPTIGGGVSEK